MCTTDPNAFSCSMALKKGPWTSSEDAILIEYVQKHGEGNWNAVQKHSGLSRCGKSCRLRWANHLRPNLKKCAFTPEEEKLIVQLHRKLGNKWARMAAQLPGRTDNEIKNYWNTRIKRRMRSGLPLYPAEDHQKLKESQNFPACKGLKLTRSPEYSASCSSSSGSIIQAQFYHHLPQFSLPLQLELPSSQSAESADSTSFSEADSYGSNHSFNLLEALLMQELAAPTPLMITPPAMNGNYTDHEELSTLLDFASVPAECYTNNHLAYVADQLVDLQEAATDLQQLLNAQVGNNNNQVWEIGSFQWNNMPAIYQMSDLAADYRVAQTIEEPLYSDSSAIYN